MNDSLENKSQRDPTDGKGNKKGKRSQLYAGL